MTTFVLVAGGHTGGWVWEATAARLREAGARAYPATLTGMGDRRHLAGPGTDLETHVEDLTQLIDHIDPVEAPEVVLVGHCYGIQPVVGAADRRADRVSRIVHVDAPMPQDGHSILDLVRAFEVDPAVRERWLTRIAQAEDGRRLPPPTDEERYVWGSTAGIPAKALARLERLAAPQPLGTLTRPLRLSGAVDRAPRSGVFCTEAGSSIAMAEALVASGDERFQPLADPRVGFFELATGHWPMLSAPDELAGVLLRAAAGEGRRVGGARPA